MIIYLHPRTQSRPIVWLGLLFLHEVPLDQPTSSQIYIQLTYLLACGTWGIGILPDTTLYAMRHQKKHQKAQRNPMIKPQNNHRTTAGSAKRNNVPFFRHSHYLYNSPLFFREIEIKTFFEVGWEAALAFFASYNISNIYLVLLRQAHALNTLRGKWENHPPI